MSRQSLTARASGRVALSGRVRGTGSATPARIIAPQRRVAGREALAATVTEAVTARRETGLTLTLLTLTWELLYRVFLMDLF